MDQLERTPALRFCRCFVRKAFPLNFYVLSRRSRRHIVAHSVSCGSDELEGKPANAGDISTPCQKARAVVLWYGSGTTGLYVARFAGLRGYWPDPQLTLWATIYRQLRWPSRKTSQLARYQE